MKVFSHSWVPHYIVIITSPLAASQPVHGLSFCHDICYNREVPNGLNGWPFKR